MMEHWVPGSCSSTRRQIASSPFSGSSLLAIASSARAWRRRRSVIRWRSVMSVRTPTSAALEPTLSTGDLTVSNQRCSPPTVIGSSLTDTSPVCMTRSSSSQKVRASASSKSSKSLRPISCSRGCPTNSTKLSLQAIQRCCASLMKTGLAMAFNTSRHSASLWSPNGTSVAMTRRGGLGSIGLNTRRAAASSSTTSACSLWPRATATGASGGIEASPITSRHVGLVSSTSPRCPNTAAPIGMASSVSWSDAPDSAGAVWVWVASVLIK